MIQIGDGIKKSALEILLEKTLEIGLSERRKPDHGDGWIYALDLREWKDWQIEHIIEKPSINNNSNSQEVIVRYLFKQRNILDGFDSVSGMNILLERNLPAEKTDTNPRVDEDLTKGCEWGVVMIRYSKNPMHRNKIDRLESHGKGQKEKPTPFVLKCTH